MQLARNLGLDDRAIIRVERSIAPLPSTQAADALIAAITIPSTRAKDLLRARIRKG